jgi:hypothetical protein
MLREPTTSTISSLKLLTAISCFAGAMTASASQLSLSSASANAGSQVVLTLSLSSASSTSSGFEWTLNAPSSMVSLVSATIGASASGANKSLICNGMTCIVVGQNATAIPNGTLASFTFQVASSASGNLAVQFYNVSEVLNDGTGVSPTVLGGVITVNPGPPGTVVTISPTSAQLAPGGTQQFTANVTGNSNTAVTWSLRGSGTLSSSGLYTAPSSSNETQTATVTATSQANSSAFANATVTINPSSNPTVSITVSPSSVQLGQGGNQQFRATVSGSSNTAVTWTLTGAGTLSSSGLYTAPMPVSSGETATVTATSAADNAKSATAKVTLVASGTAIVVTVSPTTVQLGPNGTQQFNATVTGNSNTAVTWSVEGPGTLSASGLYTAPASIASQQAVVVTATSVADASKSGSASVTLQPAGTGTPGLTTLRVNAGAGAYVDPQGLTWTTDFGYNGGSTYNVYTPISGTTTQALYQKERWNYPILSYQFAVSPGTYTVTLKFAEIYSGVVGSRVFNVVINGATLLSNFDIAAKAGGAFRALDETFRVNASTGQINISLSSVTGSPKIDAIEIVPSP